MTLARPPSTLLPLPLQVLQYHVVPGVALKADGLHDGEIEETLLPNQYLTFHKE
jgi:hypothetical protein